MRCYIMTEQSNGSTITTKAKRNKDNKKRERSIRNERAQNDGNRSGKKKTKKEAGLKSERGYQAED